MMNDRPLLLSIDLLIYLDTELALLDNHRQSRPSMVPAYDGLMSMVWCKHGFQQGISNFDGKFVSFYRLYSKK